MSKNEVLEISVAEKFTKYPGARYISDGDHSGEEFYNTILKPALKGIWDEEGKILKLDLDGTFGYASSFTSEVFTRLARDFSDRKKILRKLTIKSDDEPLLVSVINKIILETK